MDYDDLLYGSRCRYLETDDEAQRRELAEGAKWDDKMKELQSLADKLGEDLDEVLDELGWKP